jgi:hypothetical protein
MKKLNRFLICITALYVFNYSNCKKDNTSEPQLPPETTTGAMTFGCKINGKVFVPRDGRGKGGLEPEYVYLGSGPGGGWFLNIPATNWVGSPTEAFNIGTDSLLVTEGNTYEFKLNSNFQTIKGTAYASYKNGSDAYPKLNSETGSLFIKKFDLTNRILSGTFFFTGTNTNGVKLSVTEGRFDIRF